LSRLPRGPQSVEERLLGYPEHELTPEDLLHFVELDEFRDDWRSLGLGVEDDLWALETLIMRNPTGPPIVPGTGGLRKMRFAPDRSGEGKRGGVRVCYAYFPAHWTVLLVMAYGKSEKDDLSHEEKEGIKTYLQQIESWLARKNRQES
jgi:hypothetical protein